MQLWTTMKCAISNLQTELYLLIFISHYHTHLSLEFYLTHRKKIYKDLKNVHFCYLGIEKDANYSKEVIHQKQIFTISNQNNVISSSWWVLTLSFIYWNMIMIIIIMFHCVMKSDCHTFSCWFVLFKNCISSVCFFSSTILCSCARFSIWSHFPFSSLTCFSKSRFSSSRSEI